MSVTDTRDTEPVLVALSEDLDGGFVELFGAYRRLVFSIAVRVCGQWAEAEDLTAEAFLRAYRALRGYEPERIVALQPRAWLMTILLNVWRNHTRAAARRPTTVDLTSVVEPIDPRADVMGCPPGTVKSHISRGLRRLRELSAARPDVCEVSHDQR